MHKSRCVFKQLHNFFFMKATMLNVRLSSISPIIWTSVILASFMYFERLRLRTIDVEILHQSLVRELDWTSSCIVTLEL